MEIQVGFIIISVIYIILMLASLFILNDEKFLTIFLQFCICGIAGALGIFAVLTLTLFDKENLVTYIALIPAFAAVMSFKSKTRISAVVGIVSMGALLVWYLLK